MSDAVRWTVRLRLLAVPGVANAAIWGQRDRQLRIEVDPDELRALGTSVDEITAGVQVALRPSPGGFVAAVGLTGGVVSLGSTVGFVTVLGIASRNAIMLVSHYRHLETREGMAFGGELVVQGTRERLVPILMTALATGLALLPLALRGDRPGYEIEHPMAVVILGGLVSSTLMNLFLLPSLYLRWGRVASVSDHSEQPVVDDVAG